MAAIRSFIKIQPITGKSGIAQNMDQVRKGINRMGSVTDGIAKSFYDTTELLKFEKEYLTDTSKTEVTTIKRKDKKDKTKWTTSMRDFRRTFRKKKRGKLEDEAEKGVEEGKEEGRKAVEKQKPKLNMLGGLFNGLFKVFKYMIIFGALNWLSNPKNAESAVKVFKILFTIGKFAFKVTKFGVGLLLDGLTNVIGNFKEEGPIRRAFRGILGVVQLMGGLAALRTAQYLIMPWKLMKDVNRLRMIFNMSNQQSAEQDANQKVRKSGYRDKKTGVIYSKEEYEKMKKSAAKAERKNPGAGKAFEDRFGKESRFSKFKGKASAARKRFGAGANKAFGKLGGKLNVGMSVVGGAGRIAAGLASGEKASSAVGAGVGQGIGGLVGGIAGTALLGPFLGPFAPIVGNAIGSFLGEWVGKELGPIMEPIFGPIGKAFKMMFEVVKMTIGPLFQQLAEPLGLIFGFIGQLGKVLMDAAKILGDFAGFIFGGMMDAIGGTVQFVVNNAKRLMNPASVAGGIADALTFNLFDFDKENKKAAGGPVQMAAGGALQFGSHPDMLGMVGGLYLKTIVGSFGAFGFVGNKVKSVLAPDIQKIAGGLGVQVSTGGGGTAGGVSNSVQFQATQTEKKKAEAVKTFAYKENIYNAIDKGLNKLLISGIKIFDPALAKQIEEKKSGGGGQTPSNQSPSGAERPSGPAAPPVSGTKAEKWVQFREYGKIAGAKYPNLVAAQFALESGWGTALSAQHNYFGIKAAEGESATTSNTREVINGQSVYMDEPFKNFASPQDAVNHLVKQWYKDYKGYKGVNNAGDVYAAASMLKSEGYATDPNYAPHLQDLVRSNKQLMADGGKVIEDVPYLNQRANNSDKYGRPGDTQCYSTTMAMWASQLTGKSLSSEEYNKVRSQYGISTEAYPQKKALADYGIDSVLQTGRSWEDLRTEIKAGYPVPVGFKYKGSGHWGMVVGYKNNGFVVHDPFGQLNMGGAWKKTNSAGDKTNGPGKYYFMDKNLFQNQLPDGDVWMWKAPRSIKPSTKFGDGDDISTTTSEGQVKTASSKSGQTEIKPAKPKTLEEMLEAFKTGLTAALTKISTNVPKDNPTKSAVATNPTVSAPSEIKQLGAVRDKATKDLKSIGDKAQRDEDANFLPVITERLVIQKVRQTINTKGSTSAVYTKPSPLLTK